MSNKYYCHNTDMRNNRKISVLRKRLGMTGYGLWCMMLEILAQADGYTISWDADERELYVEEFGIDESTMDEFISFCTKHNMLFLDEENETLSCPALRERLTAQDEKRSALSSKRKAAAKGRWSAMQTEILQCKPMQTDASAMQTDASAMQTDASAMQTEILQCKPMQTDASAMQTDATEKETEKETEKGKVAQKEKEKEKEKEPHTQNTREGELQAELWKNETILTALTARFKRPRETIMQSFRDFAIECDLKQKRHANLRELVSHFTDWYRYPQNQNTATYGTTQRTPPATRTADSKEQRDAEFAAHIAQRRSGNVVY